MVLLVKDSAGWSATTVADPGATSVNPPSVTTGSPLASSSAHCPEPAARTARSHPPSSQAERADGDTLHQASVAPCPACAIAFPAVIGNPGFSQSTGVP